MGAQSIAQPTKPSFKVRFKAWWEGYELPGESAPVKAAASAPAAAAAADLPLLDRPATKVAQQLWGDGFTQPGGSGFILNMVKPFALNPSMTVMDFGAGLGGGTRAVTDEFGVWVQGFESNPAMAEAAQELSTRKGAKKAEIKPYRVQDFQPKPAGYDCIFSHASLYRVKEKEKLLALFERALKARGQVSLTDFVRAPGVAADDPRLKEFAAEEGSGFWLDDDYQKQFKTLKIDVRVDEDQTALYRSAIIDAWVNFTTDPSGLACAKAHPEEAVAEVGLWTRRVSALDSGVLQLRRYYGIKMGSGGKVE
ncbi:MAG TPA: methyltransferase domain-containing protein [Dongiaceae bacterium]|jgi:SAM-dependent methyltransferase|nr:methyltransferase domain-containing protein [Dongiaceae bacterium]